MTQVMNDAILQVGEYLNDIVAAETKRQRRLLAHTLAFYLTEITKLAFTEAQKETLQGIGVRFKCY